MTGPLKAVVFWYWPAKTKRIAWKVTKPDLDNICKNLLDTLQDFGYFLNDSQIVWLEMQKYQGGDVPSGISVTLEQLEQLP